MRQTFFILQFQITSHSRDTSKTIGIILHVVSQTRTLKTSNEGSCKKKRKERKKKKRKKERKKERTNEQTNINLEWNREKEMGLAAANKDRQIDSKREGN